MLITEDIRLLTTIPERIKTVVDWFRISLGIITVMATAKIPPIKALP